MKVEIRTFQGADDSLAIAIEVAEVQANKYLATLEGVFDVVTSAQSFPDHTEEMAWYRHIITLTITTETPRLTAATFKPAYDFSQVAQP